MESHDLLEELRNLERLHKEEFSQQVTERIAAHWNAFTHKIAGPRLGNFSSVFASINATLLSLGLAFAHPETGLPCVVSLNEPRSSAGSVDISLICRPLLPFNNQIHVEKSLFGFRPTVVPIGLIASDRILQAIGPAKSKEP